MLQDELTLTLESELSEDDAVVLDAIIDESASSSTPTRHSELAILLRDKDGQVFGGVLGNVYCGILYIQTLGVHSQFRKRGYGTKLLALAEQEALNRSCRVAYLDTMSFEAPGFYQKQGYTIFQVLEGVPQEIKRYLLKKELG